jgi:gas vesicle protein
VNQTILVALIGTVGVIIGAILTFLASAFTAKQKIKELEVTYRQKLNEIYLTNARFHIDTLYMPINISLTQLADTFEEYTNKKTSWETSKHLYQIMIRENQQHDAQILTGMMQEELIKVQNAAKDFYAACQAHATLMNEIDHHGKDAYLTANLEECLRSFTYFVKSSTEVPTYEEMVSDLSPNDALFIQGGFSPVGSQKFEERFLKDMHDLKSYIKEVTLGTIGSGKNRSSRR